MIDPASTISEPPARLARRAARTPRRSRGGPPPAPIARRSTLAPADYQALVEQTPGQFLVLHPDLTIAAVSDAYAAATLIDRERVVGLGMFEVFPDNPNDPSASGVANSRASFERVRTGLVTDRLAVQQHDIRRPDALGGGFEERWWSQVNSPVLGGDGRLAFIIHRVEDVTTLVRLENGRSDQERETAQTNRELQQANAELRQSEVFLDSVIENIPHMVFVKDARSLEFVRFNRAGEELLGLSQAELIGKTDHDFFPPEEADFFVAKDREVLARGELLDIPEEQIHAGRRGQRILHTKKIPIRDDAGQPAYLLGISEDITERKQAEDDVRAARQEADRANRAKTEFLSRMSHELRTPLNAILGFSQLLEMDELTSSQRESLTYIARGGRHLLNLINEVLDVSRIESGQMMLSPEAVAIAEVLDELVELVGPLASERRIRLRSGDEACDSHVLADRQRLNQVLLNLISNAVKYNRDGGSITIGCATVAEDRLRISITDSGYGIPPEYLERVFLPFDRLGAEQGSVEGTGMGLALSKGLVEAMGGAIGVDTVLDVGSTFWVELRLVEGPVERYERIHPPVPDADTVGSGERLVLQIEDNLSNRKLVERIVAARPSVTLLEAGSGRLGMEMARQRRPDLILLDLHLPDLPGHEVLRHLRSYPETRTVPVIVLSADATASQIARLLDDGAFGYLTKPLDVADFLTMVDRALESPGRG